MVLKHISSFVWYSIFIYYKYFYTGN